jgi:hypothetical protein
LVLLGIAGRSTAAPTLANFRMFTGRAAFAFGGDPTNDLERYQVLNGTDPRALPAADSTTGLRPPQLASRDDDWRIIVTGGPVEVVERVTR